MNQTEFTSELVRVSGLKRSTVLTLIKALGDVVADNLVNVGEIALPGLGKITRKEKAARLGRNPKTGESLMIRARGVVSFTPSKALKEAADGNR